MNPERARKQVFVRANLRLESKDYTKKSFIEWKPDSVESDGHTGSDDEIESDGSDDGFDLEESEGYGVEL